MKKVISLMGTFAFALLLLVSSCSKPSGDDAKSKIEGKWKFTKEVAQLILDGKVVSEESYNVEAIASLNFYFEFFSNGTFNALGSLPGEGDAAGAGTYSVFDNKLVLSYSDYSDLSTDSFIIDKLTSKELVLAQEEDETENGVTFKISMKMYFEKM